MWHLKVSLLGILIALPFATPDSSASRLGPRVAVELQTRENTLDGCMACGCHAKGLLEPGRKAKWWISFGQVISDGESRRAAVSAWSRCGRGAFKKVAKELTETVGIPYVILDLSTAAEAGPAAGANLALRTRTRKLSGFNKNGEPVYVASMQNRALSLATEGEIVLPLLVPDEHEKEAFAIHEVVLRLRARVLGREAAYGILSVSADVPGAEILLDGGFVGRIPEGRPTLLDNVLAGSREIRVRDFSGREARRRVLVEKGKTTNVILEVLGLTPAALRNDLVPIGENPQGHEEYWRAKDGAMVVRIPAGEFLMGSTEDQGEPDEHPPHRVELSAFLIDKTEVTWRQLRRFAEATGAQLPPAPLWGTPDDYAASSIIWREAKKYCEWVGGRLPTEAEWEKAARGPDGRTYLWGDEWEAARCNSRDGGPHRPLSVASYPNCASPYGVLDMAGSVWEWCDDWYAESYYAESPPRDPRGPVSGSQRVLRGAAWMSPFTWLRTAFRYKGDPTWRRVDRGFRCAQDTPE